ncbi:WbqC family protein [Patescibacteria group bacterium]|nr:WbqC family protein [Patescibacteria group bacterium]
MKGTILQPTYLSWMGYFEMIASGDVYVAFDSAQFTRKTFDHRNKIKTANGVIYLSLPVQKAPQKTRTCDIRISYDQGDPLEKHWKTIELAYKKAPYFEKYKPLFEKFYSQKYVLLRDLDVDMIKLICNILGIKTKIILSSGLNLNDQDMGKTERVISLCKKAGITHLYDAQGAEAILDKSLFKKEGISIDFQKFEHPEYPQLWGGFVPYLSVIDLIFNQGDKSLSIIKGGTKKS